MSTVTGISPNLGAIGDSVTITGTGFGAVQGGSTVTFGAVAVASYTSWSDTQIVVVVPASTVSARVVVNVSGSAQTDYKTSWFEIEDTTLRSVEGLKAQDRTADSSPEDWRYADARDYNNLLNLIANTVWRGVNDFRLTLTSGLSVTTADVTGATSVYFTPHKGNRISLYNGSTWETLTSAEVSLALGTITSGLPYDVFAYNNGGTLTLEALAWTNGTTRATALVRQDGIWCKTGALTRRYVGTFYTTSTTTTEDSAAKRFLFNADNRVRRTAAAALETANSWSYTTAAYRQANANTANQLAYVCGLAEDVVVALVHVLVANSGGSCSVASGVGVDSTTVNSAQHYGMIFPALVIGNQFPSLASYRGIPGVGYHYLAWLEYSEASGTTTWYGDNGVATVVQGRIVGELMA